MHSTSLLITPKAEAAEIPVKVLSIDALVYDDAKEYHLNYDHFYATLSCESEGFTDVAIQSKNGKRERSFGIAQINLDAHPDISMASATDPVFSVAYAAQQWGEGNASHWSCYNILKAKDWQ